MEDGTKKIVIWESNTEPPKSYIWVKDGSTWIHNGTTWVISEDMHIAETLEDGSKKTIVWESSSEIPDNWIWVKSDGSFYENKAGVWFKSSSISKIIPSETLIENEGTFAGFKLTSGPVYWTGKEFSIKNNWNYNTYESDFGKTTGSMYFKFEEITSYFNGTNTLDGYRLPTIEEWAAIVGTTRTGATVNGKSEAHNVYVTISDAYIKENVSFAGYILFPDNATITGTELTRIDGNNDGFPTSLTSEQLNVYLGQGCVFLPIDGYYDSSQNAWNSGNTFYASSVASENNSNPLLVAPMGTLLTNQTVGKQYYFPVRLIKEIPVEESVI